MEILSPVGNKLALYAAVRSGADAVYFGVGEFNARRNAENFTKNDLKEISSYCHIRGVKAYLALNTLISDEEMDDAINLVKSACEAGIDAIIINDAGLSSIVSKAAPNMILHASTQMTINNIEGVKYLKEKGFKRVVLARENSLTDITEIAEYANANGIELEIFVSGAQCMCVSGQCLLSSVLGSRSGNRGLCAQPCRLPFKVKNGNGYDLSLKDMNLFQYFDEFRNLGIASLKIEGRMKNEEYVSAATYAALCYKENRPKKEKSLEILKSVFSRSGFTDGYLTENVDKSMFGIRSEQDIENSKQIKNSIHEIYRRERQNVRISMKVEFSNGNDSVLTVTDGKHEVTVKDEKPEIASNKPTTKEDVISKLQKTGSTPYFVEDVQVSLDNLLFVSGKIISSLKQKALDELTKLRGKITPTPFYYKKEEREYDKLDLKPEVFISVHDLSQLPEKPIGGIVFVSMSSNIEKVEKLIKKGYEIGIKTPVFFNKLPLERLKKFREIGVEHALMQNIGSYKTLKEHGFIITAAPSMNIFNSYSLQDSPADYCLVSSELSEMQIKKLNSDKPKGILAYGKMPLMLFRNCPIKSNNGCKNCNHTIKDRKNIDFEIYCEDGVTRMINNRPVFMGDKQSFLNSLDFYLLSFTDETADEVNEILAIFQNGTEYNKPYTRGLYFKGVL